MHIRILGSASGEPVPHRFSSAVLLQSGGVQVLMDAGEGVAMQMARFQEDIGAIRAVVISHMHPDHVSGLFLLMQRMYIQGRTLPLTIYLPNGVLPGFEAVFPYYNIFRERWPFEFSLEPVVPGVFFRMPEMRIEAVPNGHVRHYQAYAEKYGITAESFSFVITEHEGRKIIFTADIDDLECLDGYTADVRLLLSEATHVDPDDVTAFARERHIPEVVFTHISPGREDGLPIIASGDVLVRSVEDGDVIEV
ncbi:MBL fold metallo-hydrolase [bacterium]|nr:MBL fold metallo-hydrolase [bacterium]